MGVEGSTGRRQFWLRLCRMRGHPLAERPRSGSSQGKAEGNTYKRAAGNFHEGRIRMVSVPESELRRFVDTRADGQYKSTVKRLLDPATLG